MEPQDNSDYEALLQAGQQNQAYQADIERQKALAARLRGGPELEGQMVSGHYIAPNALEVIGDVMKKRRANAADAAQTEATSGLGKSQASQNQLILARLLRAQQPQAPAPQPSPITPAMTQGAQQQGMSEY
jgi:hypothetical protein